MDLFSISQLSQYSGIKPHTIRVWEQRYGALFPERSGGNTRYYDGTQLKRLLNIVSLIDTGYKISELCSMPDEQLSGLVFSRKHALENQDSEYFVSQMISAGMNYDELLFEELFEECISKFGMVLTYKTVIHPMLVRVGLMWSSNTIASVKEHFMSNIIRQKLLRSIDVLPPPAQESDTWILFLPEDEFHEIGLLFASYLIRQARNRVIYLGSSVPKGSLMNAIKDIEPQHLLLFLVRSNLPGDIEKYLRQLTEGFKGENIFVTGNQKLLSTIDFPDRSIWLKETGSLEQRLNTSIKYA